MNKSFVIFVISTIALGLASGLLFYQTIEFQNRISELHDEILEREEKIGNLSDLLRITGLPK